jgi:hypothetical protein
MNMNCSGPTHPHPPTHPTCCHPPATRPPPRLGFEEALFRLLERSIRDMDRKIDKAKERAAAESRPKVLRPEDQRRLDDIQARIKGGWAVAAAAGAPSGSQGEQWLGRGRG